MQSIIDYMKEQGLDDYDIRSFSGIALPFRDLVETNESINQIQKIMPLKNESIRKAYRELRDKADKLEETLKDKIKDYLSNHIAEYFLCYLIILEQREQEANAEEVKEC